MQYTLCPSMLCSVCLFIFYLFTVCRHSHVFLSSHSRSWSTCRRFMSSICCVLPFAHPTSDLAVAVLFYFYWAFDVAPLFDPSCMSPLLLIYMFKVLQSTAWPRLCWLVLCPKVILIIDSTIWHRPYFQLSSSTLTLSTVGLAFLLARPTLFTVRSSLFLAWT